MKAPTSSARRYAQALFEIALDRGTLDQWAEQLTALASVVQDRLLGRALASPAMSLQGKLQALQAAVGPVDREVEVLLRMVLSRRRSYLLPALGQAFLALLRDHRGILQAEVTTAVPLDDEERTLLTERLRRYLGQTVEINNRVDPRVIGGVLARVGDRLIDDSIQGRLSRLRRQLGLAPGGKR